MKWLATFVFVMFLASLATAQDADKPNAKRARIAALIDELVKVGDSDYGYSAAVNGTSFLPVDADGRFTSGLLFQPAPKQSPALRELVAFGVEAMPQLLAHLDDARRTKIRILAWGNFWVTEDPPAEKAKDIAGALNAGLGGGEPNSARCHVITVGDLCYVAIGQIVGQNYRAVGYIPSGNTFVHSPTRSKRLCKEIRDEWSGLTAEKHRERLIASMMQFDSDAAAAKRLAYYYPEALDGVVLKLMKRPVHHFELAVSREFRKQLCETKTAAEAEKALKAYLDQEGEGYRYAILHGLFNDLEWDENWIKRGERVDENDLATTRRRRELLMQLFGQPKDVTSKNRVEAIQVWSTFGLRDLAEALSYDERPAVDRAIADVLAKTTDYTTATACIERLLARGFDRQIEAAIKDRDDRADILKRLSRTRMHLAVERKHHDRLRQSIARGEDVDKADAGGSTPLHVAAESGDEESVAILLGAKAKIDAVNAAGKTPARLAIDAGHFELAKRLTTDRAIADDACVAALSGNAKAMTAAIKKRPADVPSLLVLAIRHGDASAVEVALAAGAKVKADDKHGWQPIHLAAFLGHDDAVRLLIAAGADVNAVVPDYLDRPLGLALAAGRIKVADRLLDAKAVLPFQTHGGDTIAHGAAFSGKASSLEWLKKHGQPLDAANDKGETPLAIAAGQGHVDAVVLLIKSGVKIDAADKNKSTPLHVAIRMGQIRVVEQLIKAGANVNAADVWSVTPLRIARGCQEPEIAEMLTKNGAKN